MSFGGQAIAHLAMVLFAAAMVWAARALVPEGLWTLLDPALAVAVALGLLAALGLRVPPGLAAAAWFLLAMGVWLAAVAGPAGRDAAAIAAFGQWPVVLLLLAAALIGTRPAQPVGLTGAVLLGAALFLLALAGLHQGVVADSLRLVFLRGPVHLVICAVACVCLVLTLLPLAAPVSSRALGVRGTLVGLLPLLGFFGTVAGLMEAISALPMIFAGGSADPVLLRGLLDGLALAFETTLLGIGAAIVLLTLAALVAADEGA
ncbi:MotA/TolQ/ExbB proton channel family protein [Roseicyclus amphidinii]|jgi:hypothetical protein|uniref:MotA/TolQ/ExbB proton channel family protein n=1 Tax=Roseicyclus amphidinii TaxID=3034232 RepID=UPI0024E0597A|nr:MotA/TolQ/ExbB proton channel family protein [Roseicyclus sp. Amp-Y-6]